MKQRWNRHVYQAKSLSKGYGRIHNAIRKYGKDAFSHEVLERCSILEVANLAEECWIEFYDTTNPEKGFNLLKGGGHTPHGNRLDYLDRPGHREKLSGNSKKMWSDPIFRSNVIATSQAVTKAPEFRERMSAKVKELWQDPEFRAKNRAAVEAALQDPEKRESLLEKLRANWSDPAFREKCSAGTRAWAAGQLARTHCKNGHEFTEATTYLGTKGERNCTTCANAARKSRRTHCPEGHEYPVDGGLEAKDGKRRCATCESAWRDHGGRTMTAEEMASARFGKLRMRDPKPVNCGSHKKEVWLCDCGRELVQEVRYVTRGRSTDCQRCDEISAEEMATRRFGRLRMTEPAAVTPQSEKKVSWTCDCGVIVVRAVASVVGRPSPKTACSRTCKGAP